jgi:hypothetical protein
MSPHRDREGRTANPPGASSAREDHAGPHSLDRPGKGMGLRTSVTFQWLQDCKLFRPNWSQGLLQGHPQSGRQE